ncbi:hypothetical protein [Carp edema virus]|nr:hypothetical protein [Carp edema virus]
MFKDFLIAFDVEALMKINPKLTKVSISKLNETTEDEVVFRFQLQNYESKYSLFMCFEYALVFKIFRCQDKFCMKFMYELSETELGCVDYEENPTGCVERDASNRKLDVYVEDSYLPTRLVYDFDRYDGKAHSAAQRSNCDLFCREFKLYKDGVTFPSFVIYELKFLDLLLQDLYTKSMEFYIPYYDKLRLYLSVKETKRSDPSKYVKGEVILSMVDNVFDFENPQKNLDYDKTLRAKLCPTSMLMSLDESEDTSTDSIMIDDFYFYRQKYGSREGSHY